MKVIFLLGEPLLAFPHEILRENLFCQAECYEIIDQLKLQQNPLVSDETCWKGTSYSSMPIRVTAHERHEKRDWLLTHAI